MCMGRLWIEHILVEEADYLHHHFPFFFGEAFRIQRYGLGIGVKAPLPILLFPCGISFCNVFFFGHCVVEPALFCLFECKDTSFYFFIVANKNKKHVKNCSLPVLCVKRLPNSAHVMACLCRIGECVFLAFAFSFGQMAGYSFYQLRFMVITTFPSQSFALRTESCISSVVH